MQPCKSKYDYGILVNNYIEYNINKTVNSNNREVWSNSVLAYCSSTARNKLSFNASYLISYTTNIAKFVITKQNIYLLVDKYRYSKTTSKHINCLLRALPATITLVYVTNLENNFKQTAYQYIDYIYEAYIQYCRTRSTPIEKRYKTIIDDYKTVVHKILNELHKQTRKAVQRKLSILPSLPNELNKFTRTALKCLLKDIGVL